MKTIGVDPCVPGIRDEILFPQAKQCSPELDSLSLQFKCPFSQKFTVFAGKSYRHITELSQLYNVVLHTEGTIILFSYDF